MRRSCRPMWASSSPRSSTGIPPSDRAFRTFVSRASRRRRVAREVLRARPRSRAPRPATPEVRQVVQRPRREVVVRSQHEPRREPASGRRDGRDRRLDGLRLRQEIAGHDRDIGRRQRGEEARLLRVAPEHVQVREVQHHEAVGHPPVGCPARGAAGDTTSARRDPVHDAREPTTSMARTTGSTGGSLGGGVAQGSHRPELTDGSDQGRDKVAVGALRMLSAAVTNREKEVVHELSDDEVRQVAGKEVKKRSESIEAFEAAGRTELVERSRPSARSSRRSRRAAHRGRSTRSSRKPSPRPAPPRPQTSARSWAPSWAGPGAGAAAPSCERRFSPVSRRRRVRAAPARRPGAAWAMALPPRRHQRSRSGGSPRATPDLRVTAFPPPPPPRTSGSAKDDAVSAGSSSTSSTREPVSRGGLGPRLDLESPHLRHLHLGGFPVLTSRSDRDRHRRPTAGRCDTTMTFPSNESTIVTPRTGIQPWRRFGDLGSAIPRRHVGGEAARGTPSARMPAMTRLMYARHIGAARVPRRRPSRSSPQLKGLCGREAHPHGGRDLARVAHEPNVLVLLRRPGLARDRPRSPTARRPRRRASLHRPIQHPGYGARDRRRPARASIRVLVVLDDLAAADLLIGVRRAVPAVVGDRLEPCGHLERRHLHRTGGEANPGIRGPLAVAAVRRSSPLDVLGPTSRMSWANTTFTEEAVAWYRSISRCRPSAL